MVVIYRERNCAEKYAKFCLENGQICETALCRPSVSIRQIRAGYGALSAESFVNLKSFFTNNETFLLNKSRRAQVCRMLLMYWFIYFICKSSSSRRAHSRKLFACIDPQPCMEVER